MRLVVRRGRASDATEFLRLLVELSRFEKLPGPTPAAKKRILEDVFAKRRVRLIVAVGGRKVVGYALYFFSYSSFLALPTLYVEDVFVSEESRLGGVGSALFRRCALEAMKAGCGRMEWCVLDWNKKAIGFYEAAGARKLDEWRLFRLNEDGIARLAKKPQK